MYIGDGAKLVRDAFELAKEKAPAIIFIDELDAVGTKRFDSDKAGDREVQRTMLELLNQLDGFSSDSRIKVSRKALYAIRSVLTSPGHRRDQPNRYPRPCSAPFRTSGPQDRVSVAKRVCPRAHPPDPLAKAQSGGRQVGRGGIRSWFTVARMWLVLTLVAALRSLRGRPRISTVRS
jgi:SpoVK/Ycf46/Vps4 family AAA+-type ATPase